MEVNLNQFGKRYVNFTTYLLNAVLLFGVVFILLLFLSDGEATGKIFLALQVISGFVLLLLPAGIILAIIAKTKKLGGAVLYFIAAVSLVYWWIAGLLLLLDKGGTIWAVVGIVLSFFTGGFGLFFVTVVSAILPRSWEGVLLFIGIPLLCKAVMNFSKFLMEIAPAQIEQKIKLFEKEQEREIQAIDEKIKNLRPRKIEKQSQVALSDEELGESEDYNDYFEDDFEDELGDDYEDLDEEELFLEIERLELETERLEKELTENNAKLKEQTETETALEIKLRRKKEEVEQANQEVLNIRKKLTEIQNNETEIQNEIARMMQENPAMAEIIYESLEELDLENETAEKYSRDALIAQRKGDRIKAVALYTKALEIDSDDAINLLNRGNLLIELGRFDEGIEDLEIASEINPTLPTHNAILFKNMPDEMREAIRQKMLEKDNSES